MDNENIEAGVYPDTGDALTVLTSLGRLATKQFTREPDGEIEIKAHDEANFFAVHLVPVRDFWALDEEPTRLMDAPYSCVIRGVPLPGTDLNHCRRLLHHSPDGDCATFREQGRLWLLLDVDDFDPGEHVDPLGGEAVVRAIMPTLPEAFHGVSCWWCLTGSAGIKSGARIRLLLARPTARASQAAALASLRADRHVAIPAGAAELYRGAGILGHA